MNHICTTLLVLLFIFCFTGSSFSQIQCGFDELHRASLNDPVYKRKFDSSQKLLKEYIERKSLTAQSPLATVYKIPVVIHVIHKGEAIGTGTNISDAQINSAITSLNQFFRNGFGTSVDVEIEFELAHIDPSCMPTSGINRINGTVVPDYATNGITVLVASPNEAAVKSLSTWTWENYYNIWIVSEINNNNGGVGIQGFAYPPFNHPLDGAVILYNAFGYDPGGALGYNLKSITQQNKTLVHEIGHALDLYHSFEGDDANNDGVADQCPANVTCATDGDRICDTEPHRRSSSNCPGTNSCNGGLPSGFASNFMDYSSQACQDKFTPGQLTRMRSALELQRTSLISSISLNSYPITPYVQPVANCASTTGAGGLANDYAGIMNVSINGKDFSSSVPGIDNASSGYVNWTTDCHTLTQLVRGGMYSFSVTVNGFNDQQVRAWIDYNNNGTFDNSTEEIFVRTQIPDNFPIGNVTVSGTFTVPSNATLNSVLRLRVIDDLSTSFGGFSNIPDGCYDPAYGQAEDFHVSISSTLPVTLQSFTGKKSGEDVLLAWQTSAERNSKEFQVERSHDGVNFNRIGIVSALRNSTSTHNYSFIDRTITQENNYYRLKQVDLDDQFEYSKIVHVKDPLSNSVPFSLLSNPVQNNLDIQFGELADGKVQVRLTDITGKLILKWNGEQVANSRVRISINDKNLTKGVYILHAVVSGKQYVQKVVVK
jgi:hypothetical protein